MQPNAEILNDPLYERAHAMSRLKPDIDTEWCINFIREWEHVTSVLRGGRPRIKDDDLISPMENIEARR